MGSTSYTKKYGKKVIELYGKKCWYCGRKLSFNTPKDRVKPRGFTVDHFEPRSYGGSDELENLRPCCRACNTLKGNADIETMRMLIRLEYSSLPDFLTVEILRYLESEHGVILEMPEHKFYFEDLK